MGEGKEKEGEGKNGEKVQGKLQKYSHNIHEQSINHIALEKSLEKYTLANTSLINYMR